MNKKRTLYPENGRPIPLIHFYKLPRRKVNKMTRINSSYSEFGDLYVGGKSSYSYFSGLKEKIQI